MQFVYCHNSSQLNSYASHLCNLCLAVGHTDEQKPKKSIMHDVTHSQRDNAFGFSPFISDTGRLSLSASV